MTGPRAAVGFGAVVLIAGLALATGCGRKDGGGRSGTAAAPAGRVPAPGSGRSPSEQLLPPARGTEYHSDAGHFYVVWPVGCQIIHARTYPGHAKGDDIQMVATGCDLYNKKGEGATVTAYLKATNPDGTPAGPEAVTSRIEEVTRGMKVDVVEQHPLSGPYEGVRAFCREVGSSNILWIQGVLSGDRVYILSAWRPESGKLTDGEIAQFFQSFRAE